MEKTMEKIVALAKARGFVYPGSEIYGGLANTLKCTCFSLSSFLTVASSSVFP